MFKRDTFIAGVFAGTLLSLAAVPAFAEDKKPGYVIDKSGNPVLTKDGCLQAKPHHRTGDFEQCGDKLAAADSDGDGVTDDKDKCPNTPKGMEVDEHGCPKDSDGDGVPDSQDKCPNTPAGVSVDAYGCPLDSDGDGVPDYMDDCPNTPAELIHKVNEKGCAEGEEVIVRADFDASVLFDFDKSTIKSDAKDTLNKLAQEIKRRGANVRIIMVTGYTDRIGTDAYNMGLSERRAKSVANYLQSQGVSASSMQIVGKGESEAVGKTAAERKKDRKVIVDVHVEDKKREMK